MKRRLNRWRILPQIWLMKHRGMLILVKNGQIKPLIVIKLRDMQIRQR